MIDVHKEFEINVGLLKSFHSRNHNNLNSLSTHY